MGEPGDHAGDGVLLNNGMMWFDPEPGRPNSVAGGKTPLSNMAPVVMARDGRPWASLGASGGRRIMNCNAQLVMNMIEWRLAAQPSIWAPRIDCSTADLLLSWRFPAETVKALRAMGHRAGIRDERLFTDGFASPTAIRHTLDGVFDGGADPFYAPATAQAAHGVLERSGVMGHKNGNKGRHTPSLGVLLSDSLSYRSAVSVW